MKIYNTQYLFPDTSTLIQAQKAALHYLGINPQFLMGVIGGEDSL